MCDIIHPNIKEVYDIRKKPSFIVRLLAKQKCQAIISLTKTQLVLAADTIVLCKKTLLGKAKNKKEAQDMLTLLSGSIHMVYTGLCLYDKQTKKYIHKMSQSSVTFRCLTPSTIEWYLSTNDWKEATAAYRIQNYGEHLIQHIKGSCSGIAGLPISLLYDMLRPYGYWK